MVANAQQIPVLPLEFVRPQYASSRDGHQADLDTGAGAIVVDFTFHGSFSAPQPAGIVKPGQLTGGRGSGHAEAFDSAEFRGQFLAKRGGEIVATLGRSEGPDDDRAQGAGAQAKAGPGGEQRQKRQSRGRGNPPETGPGGGQRLGRSGGGENRRVRADRDLDPDGIFAALGFVIPLEPRAQVAKGHAHDGFPLAVEGAITAEYLDGHDGFLQFTLSTSQRLAAHKLQELLEADGTREGTRVQHVVEAGLCGFFRHLGGGGRHAATGLF